MLSYKQIAFVVVIYFGATFAWQFLGSTVSHRSEAMDGVLVSSVAKMWGKELIQTEPRFDETVPGDEKARSLAPSSTDIDVALNLDHRRKGLVWFTTYDCLFEGSWTIANPAPVQRTIRFQFDFPDPQATYDGFRLERDGASLPVEVNPERGLRSLIQLMPNSQTQIRVVYRTRGMDQWIYRINPAQGRVQNLDVAVQTNFTNVDYPDSGLSPMKVEPKADGLMLRWDAADLITNRDIGVVLPAKLNPGPMVSRITFFAPVCLFFFFLLIMTISVMYAIPVHPMHYLFVAAGFFAFHLLMAYLVDHLDVHLSFAISALIAVSMVTSYLNAALNGRLRFPKWIAAVGQLLFLVLYSYSFFWKGMTGLTVAVGSVITLGLLMKVTAHMNWHKTFHPDSSNVGPA